VDFSVKTERNHPKKTGISLIIFSVFWNAFVSVFVVAFFGPLFFNEEVHFTSNGNPEVASLDNLSPLLFPAIFIGIFGLVGIATLIWGIVLLVQKGGYFVGTETRLIKYRKGNIEIKDWEQFSGNIEIKSKGLYGDLTLELRTGKVRSSKNSSKYVPDTLFMYKVKNIFDIEKKCRRRIEENDPNPGIKTNNRSY